jgi:D-glycero-alpha-D-manno-heptose-7-phosphate kinase
MVFGCPMILTRAPLRVTICGGGTDIPAHYQKFGGRCVAAAINKYVYVALHRRFDQRLVVKYSETENVEHVDELKHGIVREALKEFKMDWRGLEIASFADIPAGTGLGSSGAFTVALIQAIHTSMGTLANQGDVARDAVHIELHCLKEPVGIQDQCMAAMGSITEMEVTNTGDVMFHLAPFGRATCEELSKRLLLFDTGSTRSASEMLAKRPSNANDIAAGRYASVKHAIRHHNWAALGQEFTTHWEHKRGGDGMSNSRIDNIMELGCRAGAYGGKLVGAGGGGFVLFVAEDGLKLRAAMRLIQAREIKIDFDYEGVRVLCV